MSIEDSIRVTERTMREMHLLPFQLAVKHANPWSFMTGYHRTNGVHGSEDPWLMEKILRGDWGWGGLVMSDWFGTYSTAEAINAGLDLEMPGPSRWRAKLLHWAVMCRKVKERTIDDRVRNLLNLVNKVRPALAHVPDGQEGDTPEKRQICRRVASESIVLLKNTKSILPLDPSARRTYGLIGPGMSLPAVSGRGSADLVPHYVSTPLDAITEVVGEESVRSAIGSHNHLFTPLLSKNISVPGTEQPGYLLGWFNENPEVISHQEAIHTTTTTQAQMYFADSLPANVPGCYWLRFGLCVLGKGKLHIDDDMVVDLFSSQPPKTLQTPMFNQASMEVTAEVNVELGKQYQLGVLLRNDSVVAGVGALSAGGLRVECCEKLDAATALAGAVDLAKQVDVPIIVAGLNSDYESEAIDRKSLSLPPAIDELILKVAQANPNTVVITQSGCPITMPWVDQVPTLLHAWFGGQETGHGIADVLFGKVNPSGRLSITFPRRLEDTPTFLTFGKGQRDIMYGEGVFIGYRYYEKLLRRPLFYFGYGLSYTTFTYSNLQVPDSFRLKNDKDSLDVSVEVKEDLRTHERTLGGLRPNHSATHMLKHLATAIFS
ncbi:hypothetical protein QQX98_008947 [Neonectria punicea]|uniref:beta-glucosidase n=1 Tax=Neonectria punicea TaxID=979145 RepID=A0ABR1GTQ3_9HYPO